MYLHMAAVLTNPNMAINKAASKYRVVPEEIPNKMINAMLLMYMVSSANMRSGLLGPINKRHKLRINDKQTSVVAMTIAVLSI
jgi:hypothetical protein